MIAVPTQEHLRTDVVIIGGGLAGLSTEYGLRQSGLQVNLLEADESIGGRTRGEYWNPAGRYVDLGASWLTDKFQHTREFATKFAIPLVETPPPTQFLTHFRSGIRQQQFLSEPDVEELALSTERIRAAIDTSPNGIMTVQAVLDQVPMHDIVYDWHLAMQRYLSGAKLDRVDAQHLLLPRKDLEDPEHYGVGFAQTMQDLVNGFERGMEAKVACAVPVRAIRQRGRDGLYTVETSIGQTMTAKYIVLAVPLNTLQEIDLDLVELESLAQFVPDGHAGASRKDWFVLGGVDHHVRVYASTGLFGYFRTVEQLDGGRMLAVGLAPSYEGTPTLNEFQHQVQQYLPNARVVAHHSFDWAKHPWAQGTWVAPPPGFYPALEQLSDGQRQLQIIGGDVSNTFPGTVEGAIETGLKAAENIQQLERSHR